MRHAGLFLAVALTGAGIDLLSKGLAFRGADLVYDQGRGYCSVRNPKEVRIIESFLSYGQATNPGHLLRQPKGEQAGAEAAL